MLLELAERLLNACAAAVAGAGAAAAAGAQAAYEADRGEVLQALLEQALRVREQGARQTL